MEALRPLFNAITVTFIAVTMFAAAALLIAAVLSRRRADLT